MYFAVEEEAAFDMYLDRERELYYVLLVDELIVGCGGINFADNMTHGKISWDIFHPDYQRKSLGSRLLRYRIEKLKAVESVRKMTVRTSQFVYGFYEKHGFELKKVVKNYWAQGFDLYDMEYKEKR
jgi:ribosomal protein S18 acetylase RimI-like enzyme